MHLRTKAVAKLAAIRRFGILEVKSERTREGEKEREREREKERAREREREGEREPDRERRRQGVESGEDEVFQTHLRTKAVAELAAVERLGALEVKSERTREGDKDRGREREKERESTCKRGTYKERDRARASERERDRLGEEDRVWNLGRTRCFKHTSGRKQSQSSRPSNDLELSRWNSFQLPHANPA